MGSAALAALALLAAPAGALKMNSWQARLDRSLLAVDLDPGSRLRLFAKAVSDPALQRDLQTAVDTLLARGFQEGHPDVIETLWPTGTTAREDIEGLAALRTQLPEALQALARAPPPGPSAAPLFDPASLPDPSEVLGSLVAYATDPAKQRELQEEALDAFRRTPKNLETPDYEVVLTLDGPRSFGRAEPIEIRAYEPFSVARTATEGPGFGTSASSRGFNTLAAYLFGGNEAARGMKMTMPVAMSAGTPGPNGSAGRPGLMAFVLPRRDAEDPPAPYAGSGVTVESVPKRLVAAKPFNGLITEEEVARQRGALLGALEAAGIRVAGGGEVTVLAYNSPFTVPWRRRNEVAVVVEGPVAASEPGVPPPQGTAAPAGLGPDAAPDATVTVTDDFD